MKNNNYVLPTSFIVHLLAIIFVIIQLSSFSIDNFARIIPSLDIMIIFYFWFIRKTYGLFFIFFLGLWHDAIIGNILGVTSLSYILTIKFFEIIDNRLFSKEGFVNICYQFIAFCAVIFMLKWLLLGIFNNNLADVKILLINWVLTILLYIVMHGFFDFLSEKMPEDASRY